MIINFIVFHYFLYSKAKVWSWCISNTKLFDIVRFEDGYIFCILLWMLKYCFSCDQSISNHICRLFMNHYWTLFNTTEKNLKWWYLQLIYKEYSRAQPWKRISVRENLLYIENKTDSKSRKTNVSLRNVSFWYYLFFLQLSCKKKYRISVFTVNMKHFVFISCFLSYIRANMLPWTLMFDHKSC